METPAQRGARLVNALETLVAEESAALHAGDFEAAGTLADRAGPVVEWLTAHADVITPGLQAQLLDVRRQRQHNAEFLEAQIARTRADLQQIAASRRRVAQIAPVYGRGAMTPRGRLSVVG